MHLSFTPATAQDTESIYRLSKQLIDRYEQTGRIDYEKVLAWVRRKIESAIDTYTCVFLQGQKVAYYRFCPDSGMMELDDLYVFPEFQNQGIGTRIIRKCCSETSLPVFLYVFTRNTRAIALYQRLGFRVTRSVGSSRCIMTRDGTMPQEVL